MEKGRWDEAAAQEEQQAPKWARQGEFVKDGLRWRLPDKDLMQEPDRSRISGASVLEKVSLQLGCLLGSGNCPTRGS